MRVDVVTIFPQMFDSPFQWGVVGKAKLSGRIDFRIHNLRDYATDKHKTVDAPQFGGGGGLVYKIEPLVKALQDIRDEGLRSHTVLLSPRGDVFTTSCAETLASYDQLILFCGRYEGVDERFSDYIDQEISIGDYILTGGEIPAMAVMDAVSRFIPGVIGQETAPYQDSFSERLLEQPVYTRPREFDGKEVPEVLMSGNHQAVERWRKEAQLNITLQRRPDLLKNPNYSKDLRRHDRKETSKKENTKERDLKSV